MANRYGYQFSQGYKPKMVNIEGFVSIGTGGLPNSVVGLNTSTGLSTSGTYFGLLPGCATAGVPTGWQGTFSGAIGLYGAGVAGVVRAATGLYAIQLSDDYVRLDSCQVMPVLGAVAMGNGGVTGVTAIDAQVVYHTVGFGNTVTTGFLGGNAGITGNLGAQPIAGASGLVDQNLKNVIYVQMSSVGPSGPINVSADLPVSAGFFIALRLRDSLAGVQ